MTQPNAERLREFYFVATEGSISSAARKLNLERATLSRRMTALEAELGVRLFLRSTTNLVLTGAGTVLADRAKHIIEDTDEAWESVKKMDETPRGTLRVSVVGNALDEMLTNYAKDFPEVKMEVIDSVRQLDLYAENIDVATRFGSISDKSLIARGVDAYVERCLVASAKYIETYGQPKSTQTLEQHKCIVGINSDGKPTSHWPLKKGGGVKVEPFFSASSMMLQRAACTSNLGITFIPKPLVAELLGKGELVQVLPGIVGDKAEINIVFKDRKYIEPKVRQFVERAVVALNQIYASNN